MHVVQAAPANTHLSDCPDFMPRHNILKIILYSKMPLSSETTLVATTWSWLIDLTNLGIFQNVSPGVYLEMNAARLTCCRLFTSKSELIPRGIARPSWRLMTNFCWWWCPANYTQAKVVPSMADCVPPFRPLCLWASMAWTSSSPRLIEEKMNSSPTLPHKRRNALTDPSLE